jgi:hypothetical protein
VWKHVENNASRLAGYEPEWGLKITGRVKKLIGNKPYPDATITLYFPDPDTDISEDILNLMLKEELQYTTKTDSSGNYDFGYANFFGYRTLFLTSMTEKGKDAGEISIDPLFMPAEEFPVKIWKRRQIDSAYRFVAENYKKDYKLTDTILLDPVTVTDRKDGYLISDREITPRDDSTWMSLDYYMVGISPCLIIPCRGGGIHIANYNYFDTDGKRIDNRVHPSKISMKEVDRVKIYRKNDFAGLRGTKNIYTIDVYAKNGKFSTMNYAERIFVANVMPGSGGHMGYADSPKLNSLKPVVTGYYEARKFYKPKFEMTDINNYYGTYFWKPDIRTDANGEAILNYNPEKQPSGKIRIEGITDGGIPTVVRLFE